MSTKEHIYAKDVQIAIHLKANWTITYKCYNAKNILNYATDDCSIQNYNTYACVDISTILRGLFTCGGIQFGSDSSR